MAAKAKAIVEISVEDKLRSLYDLQLVDSQIDKIRTVRGELPLEVQDLEDEIAGLETRQQKFKDEIKEYESEVSERKLMIKSSKEMITKYESQQMNVRNNREFDSLSKEIEFQTLEIQLCEKKIKEAQFKISEKSVFLDEISKKIDERKSDLAHKKSELDAIIAETQKDEDALLKKSETFAAKVDERLISAYKRIRKNAFNGLAVVAIDRDACGGCFNKIPPQRQLDIASKKKIFVCEHCGRIIVDSDLAVEETEKLAKILS